MESICSVGSTASFSYVPINHQKKKPKVIPTGPTCSQETYKQRVDQRRKRVVQDLNVSLTSKYKLQPAEYSPPATLKLNENLSAISGPSLPCAGPNFHLKKCSSDEDDSEDDESTLSYSSWTKNSNYSAMSPISGKSAMGLQVIKPKERLGQSMQAKTITNKNSLMEIGSISENNDQGKSSISQAFQLSRSDTMKGFIIFLPI